MKLIHVNPAQILVLIAHQLQTAYLAHLSLEITKELVSKAYSLLANYTFSAQLFL